VDTEAYASITDLFEQSVDRFRHRPAYSNFDTSDSAVTMDEQEYPAHATFTVHGCLGLGARLLLATFTSLHTHWLRFMSCFAASRSIQSKDSVGILIPDDLVGFGISASFGVYLCIGFTAGKLE